jgi:hypothetical protein
MLALGRFVLLRGCQSLPGSRFSPGSVIRPIMGVRGWDAAMWVAAWFGRTETDLQLLRGHLHPPSGKDSTSAGAELGVVRARYADLACSRAHENSVPSTHMQCRITASLRATATRAFLGPIRFARRLPHAFRGEKRCTLVSNVNRRSKGTPYRHPKRTPLVALTSTALVCAPEP